MPDLSSPILLTRREAAPLLRISVPTLDRLVKRGEIAVVRVGGAVRFRRESLERWAIEQEAVAR